MKVKMSIYPNTLVCPDSDNGGAYPLDTVTKRDETCRKKVTLFVDVLRFLKVH
jgi:hypothetical protein